MTDLSVTYMGLKLKNPLIVSSSSLTNTVERVRRCEDAGAGAVVLKSLFEEQIESETKNLEQQAWPYSHPEAFDYVRQMGLRMGQEEYLKLIRQAKESIAIPVIASLNCVSPKWWTDYAKQIAGAGADALELNIGIIASDFERSSQDIELLYTEIVESVRSRIELPLAVKIGPYFTSLPKAAESLERAGVSALVLFNRFYQIDIDIDKFELIPGNRFSTPEEIFLPLRWIAILAGRVGCDLASSTGVHDGAGLIKQLLAGANAVQACSHFYLKGLNQVGIMLEELRAWMENHEYKSINDFQGRMCREASHRPEHYERQQYIKVFVGIE